MTRVYLPTLAELIDRLTIVQLKAIFIPDHKAEYEKEMALIMQDIDAIISEKDFRFDAKSLRAALMTMLANRYIWENESKARAGGSEQDTLLKLTHSVNGCRNTAKNVLAVAAGDRLDYKIDALAANLPPEYGAWDVFK